MMSNTDDMPGSPGYAEQRLHKRRIERLNALLMISSFLLTMHKSESAAIYRGIALVGALLAAFVVTGFDYELTGRIALAMALSLACWLLFRVARKHREIDHARDEVARRAQEMRSLGVLLPPIEGVETSQGDHDEED